MIKYLSRLFYFIIFLNSVSLPQGGGLIIGDNYRLLPGTTSQSEVFITKHPTDPDILFATANTLKFTPSFFVSEGVYVTTDAGATWFGSDTCKGANIFFHGGDPAIAIDKNGTFILTRKGTSTFPGIYSHYSNDLGTTWSVQKTVSTDDIERATIVTDTNPNSIYYGRSYLAWAKLVPPYPIGFSYSNDGAQNWTTPISINTQNIRRAGGEITLGPNGEVYVCWAEVASTSPFTEINVGFASSTNGGTSWNITERAFPMNGIVGILAEKQSIRINGLPRIAVDNSNSSTRGNIYIITAQKNLSPAGSDPDIILRRSTDGGTTWSSGIRVNQDAINNGKLQFFTGITVDTYGGINVIFYDDRNTTADSSSIFLARSTDAGNSWTEYQISDHNFRPNAIGGLGQGYMGDNIDITSVSNKLYPVWMDNSTGIYQIWSAPIEIIPDNSQLPPGIVEPIIVSEITDSSFSVSFSTLREGDSKIKYGLTQGLELDSITSDFKTTDHTFRVSNLIDSTLYYFSVSSKNEYGESVSQILNVVTLSLPDSVNELPTNFNLYQNYPNPFNPGTTIEFDIIERTTVTLRIYDLTGKEIAALINEEKEAGSHKIHFNADDFGISSGVYFYRLITNRISKTRSMILLK